MFMAYLAIGVLILLGVIAMLRAYASANPHTLAVVAKRTALGSAALGAVLLLFRVPLGIVFLAIGAALPLALRWSALWPDFGAAARGRPRGKTSRISTKYLTMELNHDSGVIEGRVLAGRHRDRRLAELTFEQLLEVREDCLPDDAESVTLIEAYLDRFHGGDWRGRQTGGASSGGAARPAASAMTREEAYEVLGLRPGVGEAEIREAHHRLMMKLHPDHGGSDYLAAKINQARDLLLGA
ncbi:MAG TPA: DnaJ domain-containing protein [Candidatus Acidoferrum sp.]|nr:DnaJ domain-containing protein [Candidatus Acidoferrum sp.]